MNFSIPTNILGEVASMDKSHRLHVPARVRAAVDWFPPQGAKPLLLIADLCERGLMRIQPADKLLPQLEIVRERLKDSHSDPSQALAAFSDRYREMSYYTSDSRLHCGATIAWHMQSATNFPADFYVEAVGPYIDVMTFERRSERLELLKADLELLG